MKKIIFLSAGVLSLMLMSFTGDKEKVIESDGKTILIKDTSKISEADLKKLGELVVGWTFCDTQGISNECKTKSLNHPDVPVQQAQLQKIIDKYNR
ncbi:MULTISPECIES: hypothetical protein [Chryseobacterium]|uniref:Uncharacterized protein n=2 Tax=Chryseobacterium kwangjuense TaxID=267125 RepID=A0ABW9K906_9FLAO|nr:MULTISPECIES: hypothetical protein [Chryseobacterium]SHF57966.1 hypothetical protein SAMN02787100_2409 [Chryseobacterium sp. OV279]